MKGSKAPDKKYGMSRSPLTARPLAQKLTTANEPIRKSITPVNWRKPKADDQKFNPRDTIAYSNGISSNGKGTLMQNSTSNS